ncbi:MAG TPA: hypothetical protein VMH23_12935 [Bacteroidota bacterium]|nr:hypothetical protein [Bacteroidota bacterium]
MTAYRSANAAFRTYGEMHMVGEEESAESKQRQGNALSNGIALGIAIGVTLGVVFDDIAIGICTGVALGAAIGSWPSWGKQKIEGHG